MTQRQKSGLLNWHRGDADETGDEGLEDGGRSDAGERSKIDRESGRRRKGDEHR
jgi:hypothetical protein